MVSASTTIHDFDILKPLGEGISSYVYLCVYNKVPVVVKYNLRSRISKWVRESGIIQRVPLEVSILNQLKHRNILALDMFFQDEFYVYMVSQWIESKDLFDHVQSHTLEHKEIKSIFTQTVSGIEYIHEMGIVHLDIKDENILVTKTGHVYVIDFGSSQYIRNGPFSTYYGTSLFEPPEILMDEFYSGREQDVWQLGVLLYILITAQNPFLNTDEILKCSYTVPCTEWDDLLSRLLLREPSKRLTASGILTYINKMDY